MRPIRAAAAASTKVRDPRRGRGCEGGLERARAVDNGAALMSWLELRFGRALIMSGRRRDHYDSAPAPGTCDSCERRRRQRFEHARLGARRTELRRRQKAPPRALSWPTRSHCFQSSGGFRAGSSARELASERKRPSVVISPLRRGALLDSGLCLCVGRRRQTATRFASCEHSEQSAEPTEPTDG